MNERIKELGDQAKPLDENGQKILGLNSEYHDQWMEKFAELIVRETVKEMSHQLYWHGVEQSNNPSFYTAIQKTLEHFGVEE